MLGMYRSRVHAKVQLPIRHNPKPQPVVAGAVGGGAWRMTPPPAAECSCIGFISERPASCKQRRTKVMAPAIGANRCAEAAATDLPEATMFTQRFYRALSYAALLILLNQAPLALADEMTSFATGGYANQLRTPEMMRKIDTNGDHQVSKTEWDAYQEHLFAMMDADKSGALERTEFKGSASHDMVAFATGGFASALSAPEMATRLDADHDGKVSREEFLAYQAKIFDMMDTGKTHMLGQNEFFGRGQNDH